MSHPFDLLEKAAAPATGSARSFQAVVLDTCAKCHDAPGVHSFLTYTRGPFRLFPDFPDLPLLVESTQADQAAATMQYKQDTESWRLLTSR